MSWEIGKTFDEVFFGGLYFLGLPGGIGFYYRVYYIPLWKSPLNNQYFMESKSVFFVSQVA